METRINDENTSHLLNLCIYGSRIVDVPPEEIDRLIQKFYPDKLIHKVVCGMAPGADMAGYKWAGHTSHPVLEYPAEWNKYGKVAGFMRNKQMAKRCHIAIGLWDGSSKGTANMSAWLSYFNKPNRIEIYG